MLFQTKYILIILLITANLSVFSQKDFSINRIIDEFDGDTTVRTTWIKLNDPIWESGVIAYYRFILSGSYMFLELKTTTHEQVIAVDEGDEFIIKLKNQKIIRLTNYEWTLSGFGDGAYKFRGSAAMGINLWFYLSLDNLTLLASDEISKCRLSTTTNNLIIEPEKKKYTKDALNSIQIFYRFVINTYADKLKNHPK